MIKKNDIVHVIVNNLGGITNLTQNLVLCKGSNALEQSLFLLDVEGNKNHPALLAEQLRSQAHFFKIDSNYNWYSQYRRMAKLLSKNEGILVSNDQYELIMLQAFNIPRKIVQLVHDNYNLSLSLKYHECIDIFITHSEFIHNELLLKLPKRAQNIEYIPYGISLPQKQYRQINLNKNLKLLFLGRHDRAKGVYDLFEINTLLKKNNVNAEWVVLGKGPETEALKQQWNGVQNIRFRTPENVNEIFKEAMSADIFVFPTKFEGFPVSLLETMSCGCLPVVTNLQGGINELIIDNKNGFKCNIDENYEFAKQITLLDGDRPLLAKLQNNAIEVVHTYYNAEMQMPKYQECFRKLSAQKSLPLHHLVKYKIGSRLDQPWIPNAITNLIRKIIAKLKNMPKE